MFYQKLKNNIDKKSIINNFLFIFILASTYSIMFNIPIIEMSYPSKYLIIFIFLSIIRDYIIWFIAFLNKWVFAVFTLFTFISGGGYAM